MKTKGIWVLSAVPLLVTGWLLPSMPDEIPAHYDFMGNVDRWGSKYELFLLPVLILVFAGCWQLLLTQLKKRRLTETEDKKIQQSLQNEKVFRWTAYSTTLLFVALQGVILYNAAQSVQTMKLDSNTVGTVLIALLLLSMGNVMPKAKPNAIFGVRTPWSDASDELWAKNQRFGGKLLVATGILLILSSLVLEGSVSIALTLILIILDAVVCTVYSYRLYKQQFPTAKH